MGKHSGASSGAPWPLIIGAAAVVAAGATGIAVARAVSDDGGTGTAVTTAASAASGANTSTSENPMTGTTPAPTTPAPTTTATTSPEATARKVLAACVTRQQDAVPLVTAVATAAGHWGAHVQAETDLEAGRRSLIDVKVNTWGPTRAAGPGDVAAYSKAANAFRTAPACAAGASAAGAPSDIRAKLAACAGRDERLSDVLSTGQAVVEDWSRHLTQMGQHAAGEVDGFHAQANWLQAYHAAPAHLDPYAAARTAYDSSPACSA